MTSPYLGTTMGQSSCANAGLKALRMDYMLVGVLEGEESVMMGGGKAKNEMGPVRATPGLSAMGWEEVKSKVR